MYRHAIHQVYIFNFVWSNAFFKWQGLCVFFESASQVKLTLVNHNNRTTNLNFFPSFDTKTTLTRCRIEKEPLLVFWSVWYISKRSLGVCRLSNELYWCQMPYQISIQEVFRQNKNLRLLVILYNLTKEGLSFMIAVKLVWVFYQV